MSDNLLLDQSSLKSSHENGKWSPLIATAGSPLKKQQQVEEWIKGYVGLS